VAARKPAYVKFVLAAAPVLALAGFVGACGGGGGSPTTPQATPTPTPPPPNIVVIMADDLEAQGITRMAKLDNLLTRQGTRFANSFVTTALCGPSRATFLTGQFTHSHGVFSNGPPHGGFEEWHALGRDPNTIGAWLKAAGYRTTLIGKYINNYPATAPETYIPPGWDEWIGLLLDRRAELAFYTLNENGNIVNYRGREPDQYQTDVLAAKAVDFIRRAESNDSQPFFLFLATSPPHLPPVPAARHAGEFGRLEAPRPSSHNEDDVRDKPGYVQRTRQLTTEEIEEIDEEYTDRQRTLLALDDAIERVIQTLQDTGELGNTYVIFTSDNGIFQGEHRQTGKSAPYDEAIRVPLIVRGPGVPAGRSLDHIVGNIDLAPTFLTLARATIPETVEGRSLVPLLGNSPPAISTWRQDLLIEYLGGSGGGESLGPVVRADALRAYAAAVRGMPDFSALRTGTHTYVEYVNEEKELYDLTRDGQQLDNLMQLGGDPALAAQLASRLAAVRNCRGAACRQ
jgi:N-acetylglucosamine-6-sulfatase